MTVFRLIFLASAAITLAAAGDSQSVQAEQKSPDEVRLPNGKIQKVEILKAEHEKNKLDAKRLAELATELKSSLDGNTDGFVLSLADLKRLDEIEKLAKRIRSRLRR